MVNDGGIKRGDSAETGDEEALPEEEFELDTPGEDMEDLTIKPMTDGSLGLTDIPGHPSEDWATETGPTRNPR